MTDRTAGYGIAVLTRKPLAIAASDLSQAINGLDLHHTEEKRAFAEAVGHLAMAGDAAPDASLQGQPFSEHTARLEGIASDLRLRRHELLERLRPLREPLAEVLLEGQSLLPDEAMLHAHVEPGPLEPAPEPLVGIELTIEQRLNVLLQTLTWTRTVSRRLAVLALGPCYSLSKLIEYPTEAAMALRAELEEAYRNLQQFVLRM